MGTERDTGRDQPAEVTPAATLNETVQVRQQLTVPALAAAVASHMGVTWDELVGGERRAKYSTPRKVLGYLLRKHTMLGLQDIGDILGGRHHTTVLYWCQSVDRDLNKSPMLKELVQTILSLARERYPQVEATSNGHA